MPDDTMFQLMDLCIFVSDTFGVGQDSAQAELSIAHWRIEMGDLDPAQKYLQKAERILVHVDSAWEQAYLLFVKGELAYASGADRKELIKNLAAAERLFTQSGDTSSARRAARLRREAERRIALD